MTTVVRPPTPAASSPGECSSARSTRIRRVPLTIAPDDPRDEEVRALLAVHLDFSRSATPPEYSFALDADGLDTGDVTFYSARRDGRVVAIAALKRVEDGHAELKSMHVREADRGRGIGRELVEHLLAAARDAGFHRVSLETGSTGEFATARALYASCGFRPCGPFADYRVSPYNTFMTRTAEVDPPRARAR